MSDELTDKERWLHSQEPWYSRVYWFVWSWLDKQSWLPGSLAWKNNKDKCICPNYRTVNCPVHDKKEIEK